MSATTPSDGGYGFSLTLGRTGTSSCGAPYGSWARSSSRSGSSSRVTFAAEAVTAAAPRVADPLGAPARVRGDHLEMLGGVGVDDRQAMLEIADEHGGRLLAGERGADALGVLGEPDLALDLGVDGVGQFGGVGDQHGRGERIVLGLADQVGGDVHRVCSGDGEHRDLGGTGL